MITSVPTIGCGSSSMNWTSRRQGLCVLSRRLRAARAMRQPIS